MRRLVAPCLVVLACGDDGGPQTDGSSTGEVSTSTAGSEGSGSGGSAGSEGSAGSADDGDGSSTGEPAVPLVADAGASRYALVGETVTLDGSASQGATTYRWNFDDGSPETSPGSDPQAQVVYDTPGRYYPVLTVADAGGLELSDSLTITVTHEPTHAPLQSSTIAIDGDDTVAVVSPDSDEVAILQRTDEAFEVALRLATCAGPRTVARSGDRVVVACQADDRVELLDMTGGPADAVELPRGSRPFGVVTFDSRAFVTLQALGRVAEIDLRGPTLVAEHEALPDARGIAAMPDGRLAVTRWRSPDEAAEIALLDVDSGAVDLVTLQFDPTEASDTEAGGIPSYLFQVLVSPIGDVAAVPSLQANFTQGAFVSGDELTFETTVRGVVSYLLLDGDAPVEDFEQRKHFDNRGFLAAGVYSSRGDYLFVAERGSRAVERVDTFTGGQAGTLLDVGLSPQGLALTGDDRLLLVDAFLSREVVVYDVSDFSVLPQPLVRLPIPSAEPLPSEILRGKQLFNDSYDFRLARDGYIACAHCHLDGETDRRTWDFTDRGEGVRNTITLLGRAGTEHGPIHWSANFDEVQDFEHDIRGAFGGLGLMADRDFHAGTVDTTLGDPKAGLSDDLEALAAYVTSLAEHPRSPYRDEAGAASAEAIAGQAIFESPETGCTTCHAGLHLTDSEFVAPADPLLHDVGTLTDASGQRLGGPLLGLDTPTLHGVWDTPPYLHDGSAATLLDVLTTHNRGDQHGTTSHLDAIELDQLVAYLHSLQG